MARILGSLIGELSGKLGGYVFSRNGSGAYIRQYVKPINPNSVAQAAARQLFTNAASSYHALVDFQKANWSDFAKNLYNPLVGPNDGQFSGFNAYVACNIAVQGANKGLDLVNFFPLGDPLSPATQISIPSVVNPSSNTLSTSVMSEGGIAISLAGAVINESFPGEFSLNIQYNVGGGGAPAGQKIKSELTSGTGQRIGIGLYMSNGVQQRHDFVNSPYLFKVFQTGLLTFGDLDGISNIVSEFVLKADQFTDYKEAPIEGNYVRFTPFIYSEFGQIAKLASITKELSYQDS